MNPRQYFNYSSKELSRQVYRLIAIRLLMYLGAMSSYFIGVMGTLAFSMGAGVDDNAIAVGLLNLCIVLGGMWGGSLLDRMGPRQYFRISAALLVASGLLFQVVGTNMSGVFIGGALFGLAWGIADVIPRSFPPYLTDNIEDLKRINALVTLTGNISIVIGPLVGGIIAMYAPTQAVFIFMVLCSALSYIPGWNFTALRTPARDEFDEVDEADEATEPGSRPHSSISAGFSEIFGSSVLSLLFWATLLSFMGYGAFDPLESLFYRDVLKVGAEWMGWLSALSGVGGVIGALAAGMLPARVINVRALLVVLTITGAGSLLYVATPVLAIACVGQFVLGTAFSAFGPIKDTLVQVHTPLDRIGRVNAAMGAGYNMAGAIPLLCAPALARIFGVQGTLVAAGVLVFVVPVVILALRKHEIDRLVEAELRVSDGAREVANEAISGATHEA